MKEKNTIFLISIILLGIYLRLFNFSSTLNMDTDQGAAFLIADRIINGSNRLLVGPLTSIWQINLLPPTYYYIIAFLYLIFRSEILVSLIFTFLGILNILLMFFLGREMFNTRTGLVGALLFSVSRVMVDYSRNIWEPHLVPLVVTLSLYLLIQSKRRNNFGLFLLSIITFFTGFLYISSVIILPVYFFLSLRIFKKLKPESSFPLIKTAILFLTAFLINYFPVIIFEFQQNYPSLIYLGKVLSGNSRYITYGYHNFISSLIAHGYLFLQSLFIFIDNPLIWICLILLLVICLRSKLNILSLFLASIIFTGIYSQKIEVHRLAALYPLFFLMYAAVTAQKLKKIPGLIVIISLFFYFISNFSALSEIITFNKMDKYITPFLVAENIIRSTNNADFTIYTITPDDNSNHHSTAYWWTLEKLTKSKLVGLNKSGNWIKQQLDLGKKNIYLICRGFTDKIRLRNQCLDYFIKNNSLSQPASEFKVRNIYIFRFNNNFVKIS